MLPASPPATPTHRRRRRSRAFTLIELIVVVIIIAILAAIAGTAYNTYVSDARDTAVLATAKQVDKAITARSARDDVTPPDLVAAAFADPAGFETHLSVHGDDTTYTADDQTAPTQVEVAMGVRAACLTLGEAPGQASTVTLGACGDVVAAPDGGSDGGGQQPAASAMTVASTGGDGTVRPRSNTVLADGSTIVTGYFSGSATFGSTTLYSAGGNDVFVAKLTAAGEWSWATSGGGTGSDLGSAVAVDDAGRSVITGAFTGTATFGTTTLSSVSRLYADVFVAKLSPAGEWTWIVRGGGGGHDAAEGVALDGAGNAVITGHFAGGTFGQTTLSKAGGSYDVFVAKLSPAGEWTWAVSGEGTGNDYGTGIGVDSAGNPVVTGYFAGSVPFGSTGGTSTAANDMFVAKLTVDGDWAWATSGGGTDEDYGDGIAVDGSGNAVVTGRFTGSATFGGIPLNSTGYGDVFVAKLTAAGDWTWAVSGGGPSSDSSYGVAVDGSGNPFITGQFGGSATFGGIPLNSTGSGDVFVAKLTAAGDWAWAASGGGPSSDSSYGVAVDGSGNPIITGQFTGSATFGSTQISVPGSTQIGGFVARWKADGTPTS